VDEISIRMPTRAESEKLDLPTGTPVAEVIRTGYAEDGAPLRVMVTIAPGDRHKLIYETDAS
jgi:DNA-binding GntR family transcriptional regulator